MLRWPPDAQPPALARPTSAPGRPARSPQRDEVDQVSRSTLLAIPPDGRSIPHKPECDKRRRGRIQTNDRYEPAMERYPPEASCTLVLPAEMKGIMSRSSAPTSSIWWALPASPRAVKLGRPFLLSAVHSSAKAPERMSSRIDCMVARTASSITRGPRVRSPYSAVSEME